MPCLRCTPVAVVLAHYAVERMPSRTFASDEQVEAEGGKGAFLIIADDGVRAVFILPVKLVPCGKAGFGKGLFQTAFGLLYAGNALRKQVQIGFGRKCNRFGRGTGRRNRM